MSAHRLITSDFKAATIAQPAPAPARMIRLAKDAPPARHGLARELRLTWNSMRAVLAEADAEAIRAERRAVILRR